MRAMNLLIFIGYLTIISGSQWNYGHLGPDVWSEYYPLCAGTSQSPINILTACTVHKKLKPFKFISTSNEKYQFTLKNNGHTIVGTLSSDSRKQTPIRLRGGGLNGTFEFINFHLHWGENYKSGSEHQVNGVKYAGEIHIVYKNPTTSQMAVLAIFMQSFLNNTRPNLDRSDATREEWQKYFNTAQVLRSEGDWALLDLNLTSLTGSHLREFWRYEGSLTTPPCTEGVIWTIFRQAIPFMEEEFKILRKHVTFEDYRGPQPIYNRKVYQNFVNETPSSIPDYNRCSSDSPNKTNIEELFVFGPVNCSSFSFFLILSVFYAVFVISVLSFCKIRHFTKIIKLD